MNFYIPSPKLQPFLQYIEDLGLDIKTMPEDLLHKQWLYFLGEAPSAPFYCQGWMMEDKMCTEQCISCSNLQTEKGGKIKTEQP